MCKCLGDKLVREGLAARDGRNTSGSELCQMDGTEHRVARYHIPAIWVSRACGACSSPGASHGRPPDRRDRLSSQKPSRQGHNRDEIQPHTEHARLSPDGRGLRVGAPSLHRLLERQLRLDDGDDVLVSEYISMFHSNSG